MYEPGSMLRQTQRMRRRASSVYSLLRNHFSRWAATCLVVKDGLPAPAPLIGRLPQLRARLLLVLPRRAMPARRRHCVADSPRPWEQPLGSPGQSATLAANRRGATVIPIDLRRIAKPPVQRRVAVIGDCENDTDSVESSLRFVGFLGKKGEFKAKARGAHLVQTGDLLHKNAPSPAVVSFWEGLRTAAESTDCALHLVAGNHELEIWRRLRSGERLGLKRGERQAVLGLIRTAQLFHVEGSMLFIHGYPTVKLLRHMQAYRIGTGKRLNDYNQDCFQPAFDRAKLLARYAYPRTNSYRGSLLHDVPDPARYYRRHGREVAALLGAFGIDLVVHGHRPERTGVQKDYELQSWLPGIRLISNDIQLRLQGLGATVIRQVENGPTDLIFVNRKSSTPAHRADARSMLRAPDRTVGDPLGLKKAGPEGQVSSIVRGRGLRAPACVARKQVATARSFVSGGISDTTVSLEGLVSAKKAMQFIEY